MTGYTDILIFTEVNVHGVIASTFQPDGFHSALCRDGRKGGGVLMFINNKWLSDRLDVYFEFTEVIMVKIEKLNRCFNIYVIYKPRSSNLASFCNQMSQFLNRFNSDNILLTGDFNIDVLSTAKPGVSEYLNVLWGFAVENVISDFTREETMGNKMTKTCIDHILLGPDNFIIVPGMTKNKVADHYFTVRVILFWRTKWRWTRFSWRVEFREQKNSIVSLKCWLETFIIAWSYYYLWKTRRHFE